MNTDPRSALAALITALERHYEAAAASRDDDDPALDAATDQLTTAFDAYDDALFDAFDIATSFVVVDEDVDDVDEEFDDLDDLDEFAADEDYEDVDVDDEDGHTGRRRPSPVSLQQTCTSSSPPRPTRRPAQRRARRTVSWSRGPRAPRRRPSCADRARLPEESPCPSSRPPSWAWSRP